MDKQLGELVSTNERGGGFGCPEAAAEHDRKNPAANAPADAAGQ